MNRFRNGWQIILNSKLNGIRRATAGFCGIMDSESLKIAYCAERQPKWLSFCEISKKCYN